MNKAMLTGIMISLAAATVDDTFAGFNTLTQPPL